MVCRLLERQSNVARFHLGFLIPIIIHNIIRSVSSNVGNSSTIPTAASAYNKEYINVKMSESENGTLLAQRFNVSCLPWYLASTVSPTVRTLLAERRMEVV